MIKVVKKLVYTAKRVEESDFYGDFCKTFLEDGVWYCVDRFKNKIASFIFLKNTHRVRIGEWIVFLDGTPVEAYSDEDFKKYFREVE